LGAIEGLTRLCFPAFDPSGRFEFDYHVGSLVLAHPGAVARQVKNTGDFDVAVRINRHGLRDDKDIAEATPHDVVVVGDSVAWGWGVETRERFSDLLDALTGLRVFNLSTPTDLEGYDVLLRYAESLGAHVGIVVLAVSMETDLRLYQSGEAERQLEALDFSSWKLWLERHSAAYLYGTAVIHQTPWLNRLAVRLGLIVPNLGGMSFNRYSPALIESSANKVVEVAKRYRTLVMIIPSRGLWTGANRAVEDRVHRSLVTALQERGLDVLDLRPLMEAGGAPLEYHFANDGHWNPRGHRLAARALAGRLRSLEPAAGN
jgi:lysophospholipase L1-like esterase